MFKFQIIKQLKSGKLTSIFINANSYEEAKILANLSN